MTKKAKIDIDLLFTGDCISQAERMAIAQSELFPIVAAIYNATEGRIKCGPVVKNLNLPDRRGSVILSNSAGVPVFEIWYENKHGKGKQIILDTIDGFSTDHHQQITSSRAAYIFSQIKKGRMKSVVENAAVSAEGAFDKLMRRLVTDSISYGFDKSNKRVSMNVPDDDIVEMVKMVATGGTPAALPVSSYESIMNIYNQYREKLNSVSDSHMKFVEFWSRNKWLMLFDPYRMSDKNSVNDKNHEGGFLLIRINGERMAMQASLRLENQYGRLNYAQAIDSVTWYKNSPNDIEDPVIRAELLSSLMMLKVHTDSDKMYPELRDNRGKVYEDLGALVVCGDWSYLPVVVVE